MNDTQKITHLSATQLRALLQKRDLSPVEVVQACLEQVTCCNDTINAIVTLNEHALDEAQQVQQKVSLGEKPGLLYGLPVGIKDVTSVAGLRTTFGSPLYADYVPKEDALVVQRLRQAGAIILGKTNCPEFGAGGNTFNEIFGATRNPWNLNLSAGGSTGGGAAGLASGMIALAEGTDLGGSLRIPASFCGVVGLRPSLGLVPTHPNYFLWDTLQVSGPLARKVEDVALMLQVICGVSPETPLAQSAAGRDFVAAVETGIPKGLKVAYCPDIAGIGIDKEIEGVCRKAALQLANAGVQIEQIEVDLSFARQSFLTLRGYWFVTQFYQHLDRIDEFGVNVRNNLTAGLQITAKELAAAEHARGQLWRTFFDFFQEFDHLLTPCMAVPPFPVQQNYPEMIAGQKMETYVDWIAPTFVLTLTGLPVLSVPCGLDANNLPVGLQIVGRRGSEESVLALAKQVQEMNPIGLPQLPVRQ